MFTIISKIFFIGALTKIVTSWIYKRGFKAGAKKAKTEQRRSEYDACYEPYEDTNKG